ncbi:MAG: dihydrofolate reductase [Verrucomicrobiota bacterium]|nr:dihydrofolate reductase [Verrucomicrobiota bacterium]
MSEINIIVACGTNRVIGREGRLPWKIQADWDYFLDTTQNGILIMGRKCFEDFLPYAKSREVMALSRDPTVDFPHAKKASSLKQALEITRNSGKTTWICGGEKIYQEAMPLADHLYLTAIDAAFDGDVHFPPWEKFFTRELSRKSVICGSRKLEFLILGK